ncbi:MAG TPA: cell division protein ZapA [Rhodocyclaceae bacterium]|jgi:cell division protein ZapA|nr:cell division protein ZapA [Rhodocyclaceae bacterium]
MNRETDALDVNLMGRDYRVACPPGEREALLAAVSLVDGKMRDLAERSRASGDRLLVMTALNIAHELLQLRQQAGGGMQEAQRRIVALRSRIDEALAQQEQLF